jgi:ABC-type oligopeptide transport system substrate-binding subunit
MDTVIISLRKLLRRMHFMKRIIAMLLLTAMLATTMFGCGYDPEDKGAIIPLYIGNEQTNYDPTAVLYDKDTVKYLGLVFQGLTTMTSDGNSEIGLAKDWYTKVDDQRG